jgi:hypothetical protein
MGADATWKQGCRIPNLRRLFDAAAVGLPKPLWRQFSAVKPAQFCGSMILPGAEQAQTDDRRHITGAGRPTFVNALLTSKRVNAMWE